MATLVAYPDSGSGSTTVDGLVGRSPVNESWASIIAGAGNASDATGFIRMYIGASSTSNQFSDLVRAILTFDTSAIGAGNTPTAATLSLFYQAKSDSFSPLIAPDVNIYGSTPASDNALVNGDYGQIGSTPYASALTYASITAAAYNDFVFNAAGIAAVSRTGITRLGYRNASYDVAAVQPTWTSGGAAVIDFKSADTAGTTNDPKLTVTHLLLVAVDDGITEA